MDPPPRGCIKRPTLLTQERMEWYVNVDTKRATRYCAADSRSKNVVTYRISIYRQSVHRNLGGCISNEYEQRPCMLHACMSPKKRRYPLVREREIKCFGIAPSHFRKASNKVPTLQYAVERDVRKGKGSGTARRLDLPSYCTVLYST